VLFRLLRERERTVKELCDLLGESSTRLYYHVSELERVGLVRLVRTEARSGIVQKYYRSVSRFVNAPYTLLHGGAESEEARAAIDWYTMILQQAASDLRNALLDGAAEFDKETAFITRNYIRTTPERAREFVRRLHALQEEMLAADEDDGPFRMTLTLAFLPTQDLPHAGAAPDGREGGSREDDEGGGDARLSERHPRT
jgi:DNA-binding transcriptional ArsR family regulator